MLAAAYHVNPDDHQNAFDLVLAYKAGGEIALSREVASQMLVKNENLSWQDEAKLRRMLGDLDEALGDLLASVKEDERAVSLDGSEENYFAWGAELLLHRAAVPASEVFSKGVRAHPDSARMMAGLGAALYTSGSADEAAQRLCEASDLEPAILLLIFFSARCRRQLPRRCHVRSRSWSAFYTRNRKMLKRTITMRWLCGSEAGAVGIPIRYNGLRRS
jgi:tetratricopeptide (TPR) repeat protein